jgi:DNA-binding transcriptional MerR regulator
MATTLTIGEFSRMTYLSVKALRHYHDVGVLVPATIDPSSGYRGYDTEQVTSAQVIRRLRDLGMPLDAIRAVLLAPDLAARNREITAHLERMERQLEQTQTAVSGLRALLGGTAPRPVIEFRAIPAATVLAVVEVVSWADAHPRGSAVFAEMTAALGPAGLAPAGPTGAMFRGDFFEQERGEVTAFLPVRRSAAGSIDRRLVDGALDGGRVRLAEIGAIEAAVAVHDGPLEDVDRTYGALGTAVAERAIGVDGPVREYYPDGFTVGRHRTEVCWPVFLTGGGPRH